MLRILHIASTYPSYEDPIAGVYYKRQIEVLPADSVAGVVVTTDMPSLRGGGWRRVFRHHFEQTVEEGIVPVMRRAGWNVPGLGRQIWMRLTRRLCEQAVQRFGAPHVIHAHNTHWAGLVAAQLGERWNIPWVISEHSSRFLSHMPNVMEESATLAALKGASEVIVVGKGLADAIKLCSGRVATIVPNVVDCDFFTLPPQEEASKEFRVLFVGGLVWIKNATGLVRAFASAFRNVQDARLDIVGSGGERESIEAEARRLGIQDRLEMRGSQLNDGVRKAMWRAGVLCVPSHHETFCIVAAEALATGLPVIATRSGGPEDFVSEGLGWLVTAGDETGLADALRQAFERRTTLRLAQHLRRERIYDMCSSAAISKTLIGIYRETAYPCPMGMGAEMSPVPTI